VAIRVPSTFLASNIALQTDWQCPVGRTLFGFMTRSTAEQVLEDQPEGTFIVIFSEKYALSFFFLMALLNFFVVGLLETLRLPTRALITRLSSIIWSVELTLEQRRPYLCSCSNKQRTHIVDVCLCVTYRTTKHFFFFLPISALRTFSGSTTDTMMASLSWTVSLKVMPWENWAISSLL